MCFEEQSSLECFKLTVVDVLTCVGRQFIFQNGGYTRMWVSLKSVFFPSVLLVMAWFWKRINQLARPPTLLEYCIAGECSLIPTLVTLTMNANLLNHLCAELDQSAIQNALKIKLFNTKAA